MRKKDVEKRITAALEDAGPLDGRILDRVKNEIRAEKNPRFKPVFKYALTACISIVICLAAVLAIVFSQKPSEKYRIYEYTSMRDYAGTIGLQIKTYNQIKNLNHNGQNTEENPEFLYKKAYCKITEREGQAVCIEEAYEFISGDKIKMSILLQNDDSAENELFPEYTGLEKTVNISGADIGYSFDGVSGMGKARFNYSGYRFYAAFDVQSEEDLILHLRVFLNSQ